jgi:TPR repeat protein
VLEDYKLATEWLCKAAEQGHMHAQYHLAICHDNGWGVDKDFEQSFRLYLKAASLGHPHAMHALSLAYYNGVGVAKDSRLAQHWDAQAKQHGYK